MKALHLPGIITSISAKQDGSLRYSTVTPELSPEQKVEFMKLQNKNLNFLIEPLEGAPEVVTVPGDIKRKSKSQALRDRIYALYSELRPQEEFEAFYNHKMDVFMEIVSEEIDEAKGY